MTIPNAKNVKEITFIKLIKIMIVFQTVKTHIVSHAKLRLWIFVTLAKTDGLLTKMASANKTVYSSIIIVQLVTLIK